MPDTTTKTRTPAEELRAAATKLRETAEKATPGPWGAPEHDSSVVAWRVGPGGFDDDFDYVIDQTLDRAEDADWIALAHPGLAEPLAEWLEMEAHMAERRGLSAEGNTFHALKVARAINGEVG
jgi:hypothetical protein